MMIAIKVIFAFAIIFYAGIVTLVYLKQDSIVFHPEALPDDHRYEFPMPFEEGFLKLPGIPSVNYLVFTSQAPKATFLYFHGNAGSLDSWGFIAAQLAKATGCRVLVWDFPGFGKSQGRVPQSAQQMKKLGQGLLDLIKQNFPEQPVILFGRSIGSGMASQLAADQSVSGLILETPYLSTRKLAQEMMPWAPSALLKLQLSNKNLVNEGPEKVMLLHGTRDEVIAYQHSIELAHLLGDRGHLVTVEGGGHNNLIDFGNYWPEIILYLKQRLSI
jgi:pimeloyl-ACP methyl ester carboxylesterase